MACIQCLLTATASWDLWEGQEGWASAGFPNPLTAMGSKFRKELEQTRVQIPPASCHVPLPGKETSVLEKRKQTQKDGILGIQQLLANSIWANIIESATLGSGFH